MRCPRLFFITLLLTCFSTFTLQAQLGFCGGNSGDPIQAPARYAERNCRGTGLHRSIPHALRNTQLVDPGSRVRLVYGPLHRLDRGFANRAGVVRHHNHSHSIGQYRGNNRGRGCRQVIGPAAFVQHRVQCERDIDGRDFF